MTFDFVIVKSCIKIYKNNAYHQAELNETTLEWKFIFDFYAQKLNEIIIEIKSVSTWYSILVARPHSNPNDAGQQQFCQCRGSNCHGCSSRLQSHTAYLTPIAASRCFPRSGTPATSINGTYWKWWNRWAKRSTAIFVHVAVAWTPHIVFSVDGRTLSKSNNDGCHRGLWWRVSGGAFLDIERLFSHFEIHFK